MTYYMHDIVICAVCVNMCASVFVCVSVSAVQYIPNELSISQNMYIIIGKLLQINRESLLTHVKLQLSVQTTVPTVKHHHQDLPFMETMKNLTQWKQQEIQSSLHKGTSMNWLRVVISQSIATCSTLMGEAESSAQTQLEQIHRLPCHKIEERCPLRHL